VGLPVAGRDVGVQRCAGDWCGVADRVAGAGVALTPGRRLLLRAATENEFAGWVKFVARREKWKWKGVHIRWSQGVLESVHTLRRDGWSEAYGLPDWLFWSEERGQSFWAELKSWSGRVSQAQQYLIPSMRAGGMTVFIWRPQDEEEIERIFRDGL
jgi:hypothetical protein